MKLTFSDVDSIDKIFNQQNHYSCIQQIKTDITGNQYINIEHEIFATNYLGQLKNWHSFSNNDKTSAIVCYQSEDEPSWFITDIYGTDDITSIILEAIKYNEDCHLYKFYIAIPTESIENLNLYIPKYDYFDEAFIKEKTKCFYTTFWQVLYKRTLPIKNNIIRCYFLKKEYRTLISSMSNI